MPKWNAIYGAGANGTHFYNAINKKCKIDFFIDQFINVKEVLGVPVYRLAEISDPQDVILYVSVPQIQEYCDRGAYDLIADLKTYNFRSIFDFVGSINKYPEILKDFVSAENLWMRKEASEMLDYKSLAIVENLLCDDQSKDLLSQIMRFRKTMVPENYTMPDGQSEYFPQDIDVFNGIDKLRFVDAGAYNGDTISELFTNCTSPPVEYIACFEPENNNIKDINSKISALAQYVKETKIFIFPLGVWSENRLLPFTGSKDTGKFVGENPTQQYTKKIPVCSLDSVLSGAAPNFIKMDIEGAEHHGLKGAYDIIARHRPTLAICVYHQPSDLWSIPCYINREFPGYKFFLRQHGHMGLSTVLYCLPV